MSKDGDVDDPETGWSPFPGNTNQLVRESGASHVCEAARAHLRVACAGPAGHRTRPLCGHCQAHGRADARVCQSKVSFGWRDDWPVHVPDSCLNHQNTIIRYADSGREVFKSPTRLECMMQDIAAVVGPKDNVGFTLFAPTEYDARSSTARAVFAPQSVPVCTGMRPSRIASKPHASSTQRVYPPTARLRQS